MSTGAERKLQTEKHKGSGESESGYLQTAQGGSPRRTLVNGRAILSIRRLRRICSCSERNPIFLVSRDRDDMFTFRYIKRILRIVPDAGGVRTSPNWTIQPPSCWPNVGTSFRTKSKCRFGSRFLCSSAFVFFVAFFPRRFGTTPLSPIQLEALKTQRPSFKSNQTIPKNLAAKHSKDLIATRQQPPSEMQQTKVPIANWRYKTRSSSRNPRPRSRCEEQNAFQCRHGSQNFDL